MLLFCVWARTSQNSYDKVRIRTDGPLKACHSRIIDVAVIHAGPCCRRTPQLEAATCKYRVLLLYITETKFKRRGLEKLDPPWVKRRLEPRENCLYVAAKERPKKQFSKSLE